VAAPAEWRAWACILIGVAAFVVLGKYGGLVPATFAIVFISALGDRDNTVRSAFVLAVAMCIVAVVVFWWLLQVRLPLVVGDDRAIAARAVAGFGVAVEPHNLLWVLFGVFVGNLIGVLPGMGPLSAISILLPLTYAMAPVPAILMLAGIFYGSQYGGAIGAILLNLPCHPPHAVTCLDGYPLTLKGKGGTALGVTMIASFFAASVVSSS